MKMRIRTIGAMVLAIGVAVVTVLKPSAQGGNTQGATQTPTVVVTTVVSKPLDRPLALPGDLVAYQDVELRSKVSGFVDAVPVDRGSRVKRGELLVRIVAPELASQRAEADARIQSAKAQRIEAEAKLASDQATFDRLKAASATPGVVAGNDVEVAQRAVEADRARVDQWKENETAARDAAKAVAELEAYLRVTAPFDGVVTQRDVHVGSLVGPTVNPMLRVQQVSRLRLVVDVPEAAVESVREGEAVTFTVPAHPGEAFTGKVARIGQALDSKTRTMPVEVDVENANGRLAPGMYAQVAWAMRRAQPSLFVPGTAIATTTERTFVVRIKNNRAEWVDVKRGVSADQLVEVFGALNAGDQVAVRGTDEIRQGTTVQTKAASGR
jgi:RND family efflux transporter MFP subunit